MRVIARHTLVFFWQRHRETEQPLRDWLSLVRRAEWSSMGDVKSVFAKASIINRERVVFEVLGGNYRLVVAIKFSPKIVFIKFIGRTPSTIGSIPRPSAAFERDRHDR